MRCKRRLWFTIALLWYLLNVMVLFLLGGWPPVIRIHGFNSTISDGIHVALALLVSAIANVIFFVISGLCQSPENKVEESDKNGHHN